MVIYYVNVFGFLGFPLMLGDVNGAMVVYKLWSGGYFGGYGWVYLPFRYFREHASDPECVL